MASELDTIRRQRYERRLNCAILQADLHATGGEHQQLIALKHATRAGHITITDAIAAVNALRAQQHHRAA